MSTISFSPAGISLEMKPIERLWNAMNKAGIEFVREPNCKGNGRCRKCLCRITFTNSAGETEVETKMSCQSYAPEYDATVETLLSYQGEEER